VYSSSAKAVPYRALEVEKRWTMCGITGFIDTSRTRGAGSLAEIAQRMAGAMRHRGPDDDGIHVVPENGVALGFRRLAIIDLSAAGHQPMLSADGRWSIVYNGEIYNAEELRPALLERGVQFRGHSDTEVLLESFAAFGVAATLAKTVGMFAMAVHDRERRETWFSRDRLGKKPLYIGRFGATVMFASELRCFRAHPEFKPEIDPAAVASYARFGYVPQPQCIFKNVVQLAPGGLAKLSPEGQLDFGSYWNVSKVAAAARKQGFAGSPADAVEELDRLLRDAVGQRMVSDVPLGAFLSGGIDSSVVVALMQAQSARPVKTFSIGFPVAGFDEAPHAKAVAQHLGTDHEELYLSPQDALDLVPALPEIYDEPFSDSSQIPTYLVSQMARKHVTVALSGDGGDESFAGYGRYRQIEALFGATQPIGAQTGSAVTGLSQALKRFRRVAPGTVDRFGNWASAFAQRSGPDAIERAYLPMASMGLPPERMLVAPKEQLDPIWSGALAADFPTALDRAQILDFHNYLPSDILTKVDRASMAVSLEVRAPLLDHRVVEFAWRLPAALKFGSGAEKWALRQVLYRYVPAALIDRPKMGFGVPIDVWLRGPLKDWAEALIAEDRLKREGLFRADTVRDLWNRHQAGETWQYPLWTVLMFQAWREHWGL